MALLKLVPLTDPLLVALAADPVAALGPLCPNASLIAHMAKQMAEAIATMQRRNGTGLPWGGYLAQRTGDQAIVGSCAFKGPPAAGAVEIAYFTFPLYERQGCATAMAGELIKLAFKQPTVQEVIAHTLPQENRSTRVLRRHGFQQQGTVQDAEDGEVWRWSLPAH